MKQSCLHFEVNHRTQTWAVAYRSFAGRASAGMLVWAESVIVRFWRSQNITASGTPRFWPSRRPSRTDLARFPVVQEKTYRGLSIPSASSCQYGIWKSPFASRSHLGG